MCCLVVILVWGQLNGVFVVNMRLWGYVFNFNMFQARLDASSKVALSVVVSRVGVAEKRDLLQKSMIFLPKRYHFTLLLPSLSHLHFLREIQSSGANINPDDHHVVHL